MKVFEAKFTQGSMVAYEQIEAASEKEAREMLLEMRPDWDMSKLNEIYVAPPIDPSDPAQSIWDQPPPPYPSEWELRDGKDE